MSLSESKISLNGCDLRLRREGAGAPLLFLHGPQGFADWPEALHILAGSYDVLAPDLPGFGESSCPDSLEDVEDLAYFFLDFLKARGLEQVHIVGHSLGGWIALEMAVRSTQSVASLTLVDAAGLRVIGVPRADIFICPPEELARLLYYGDGWQEFVRYWTSPEFVDLFDGNRRTAAKFCWQPRLFDPRLERWLHRIDVPVHIVWGAQDKVIPQAYGEALHRFISGSRLTLLRDCGHMSYVEQPRAFAAAASEFIREIAR